MKPQYLDCSSKHFSMSSTTLVSLTFSCQLVHCQNSLDKWLNIIHMWNVAGSPNESLLAKVRISEGSLFCVTCAGTLTTRDHVFIISLFMCHTLCQHASLMCSLTQCSPEQHMLSSPGYIYFQVCKRQLLSRIFHENWIFLRING